MEISNFHAVVCAPRMGSPPDRGATDGARDALAASLGGGHRRQHARGTLAASVRVPLLESHFRSPSYSLRRSRFR